MEPKNRKKERVVDNQQAKNWYKEAMKVMEDTVSQYCIVKWLRSLVIS